MIVYHRPLVRRVVRHTGDAEHPVVLDEDVVALENIVIAADMMRMGLPCHKANCQTCKETEEQYDKLRHEVWK